MDLLDQNYYEILEITAEATPPEVERAYRIARATYQPASTATYSVYSDEENGEILRRVEEAFAILADARLRREYDARLRRQRSPEVPRPTQRPVVSEARPEPVRSAQPSAWTTRGLGIEFDEGPSDGVFDGPALRRVRIQRGIELDEIAAITKINEAYLRFVEANRYPDLPAAVYLRGFLREIAKCLRLDPKQVVDSYMERHDQGQATV